jgi:RHS repeat-associated protein
MKVGSSLTTDKNGVKTSEMRYKPWGEVRSWWTSALATTPAYKLADYTFTGQYSYMDDLSTPATEGFGLMFYNARFYDPYLNHFTQPDSIVPDQYNPQDWDHYSYARNNPLQDTDPSGHSVCGLSGNGMCDKDEELIAFADKTVLDYGGRNDLEGVARIVDKAAKLYKSYDEMIPALSMVFLGLKESNFLTVVHAAFSANPCAAVGRQVVPDCAANAETGAFGDAGFHPDFRDRFSQPFHFWAYLATAANTEGIGPASYVTGRFVGFWGNFKHEIFDPAPIGTYDAGASWQDYALASAGTNIGTLINLGVVPPGQLGSTIRDYVGTGGPGAYYVNPLIFIWPLDGNMK